MSRRAGPSGEITRLTLLGMLAARPMYGYELRQQMKLYDMEHWVDIRPGSIYSALPRMATDGLLEVTDVSQKGNRPQKTVYGVTEAGRAELIRLLRAAWAKPAGMAQPVDVALFFIWLLPPEEVAASLEDRIAALDGVLAQIAHNQKVSFDAIATAGAKVPPQYVEMMTDLFAHSLQMATTEKEWSQHTLERVASGVFNFGPGPPTGSEEANNAPGI